MSEIRRNEHNQILDRNGEVLGEIAAEAVVDYANAHRGIAYSKEVLRSLERVSSEGDESDMTRHYHRNIGTQAENAYWAETDAIDHFTGHEAAYVQHAYEDAVASGRYHPNYPEADPIPDPPAVPTRDVRADKLAETILPDSPEE